MVQSCELRFQFFQGSIIVFFLLLQGIVFSRKLLQRRHLSINRGIESLRFFVCFDIFSMLIVEFWRPAGSFIVVAYVGRISLKREPQVNKPAVRALNYYLYKDFRHSTHTGIRTAEISVLLSLKVPHRCTRHCNKGCVQIRVMPSPRRRCVLQKRGRLQACRQERMCGDLDRAKPSSSARIQIPQPSGFCPRGATSRRMPVQTHR